MTNSAHLWAFGYDDMERAQQVREVFISMASPDPCLLLMDIAVLVRHPDGAMTFDRQPFPVTGNILAGGTLGFLAGLALASPLLTEAAVGALESFDLSDVSKAVGINENFKRDVAAMMKPGTSALLVLDVVADLKAALKRVQGLGGTVLKTNVNVQHAKMIQSMLRAKLAPPEKGAT